MTQFGSRFAGPQRPSAAFVGSSWIALGTGMLTYTFALFNAGMAFNEKAYYFTILMYGLFSAVSLQKTVRDRLEGIPSTSVYFGLSWISLGTCLLLMTISLWNAEFTLAAKGFYAMAYLLSLFAAVAVQKNVRDLRPFTFDAPETRHADGSSLP